MRLAPVLALTAGGCSLLVPLQEYVGSVGGAGTGAGSSGFGQLGGGTSNGGLGGSSVAGSGARGGTRPNGGSDATGGSEGGGDNGGAPGPGGMAGGDDNGGDGSAQGGTRGGRAGSAGGGVGGTAGTDTGGLGGLDAGRGGVGGSGGQGGSGGAGTSAMSGSSGAGAGGCAGDTDYMTDPDNCGSCGNKCVGEEQCLEGSCADSPCDGICTVTSSVTLAPGLGYKADNIGGEEVCAEVIGYAPASGTRTIVCWNFSTPRYLQLNGTPIDCMITTGQAFDVPPRAGGYCVHVGAGTQTYRGFEFPD